MFKIKSTCAVAVTLVIALLAITLTAASTEVYASEDFDSIKNDNDTVVENICIDNDDSAEVQMATCADDNHNMFVYNMAEAQRDVNDTVLGFNNYLVGECRNCDYVVRELIEEDEVTEMINAASSTGVRYVPTWNGNGFGYFAVPALGIGVNCYDSWAQSVVDAENSAAYFEINSHAVIGDHVNQSFAGLSSCSVGTKATFAGDSYTCVGKINGKNTGSDLTDAYGNPIDSMYPGALVTYTCRSGSGNVTICFWQNDNNTETKYEGSYGSGSESDFETPWKKNESINETSNPCTRHTWETVGDSEVIPDFDSSGALCGVGYYVNQTCVKCGSTQFLMQSYRHQGGLTEKHYADAGVPYPEKESSTTSTPTPEVVVTPEPEVVVTPKPLVVVTPKPVVVVTPEPEVVVTPEPEVVVTPEPEVVVTPEPEVVVTPEPEVVVTPEPESTVEPITNEAETTPVSENSDETVAT